MKKIIILIVIVILVTNLNTSADSWEWEMAKIERDFIDEMEYIDYVFKDDMNKIYQEHYGKFYWVDPVIEPRTSDVKKVTGYVQSMKDKRTEEEKNKDLKTLGSQITVDLIKKYEEEGNMKYANHYRKLLNKSKEKK